MRFCFHPAMACPLDKTSLALTERELRCAQGHAYDVAAKGYAHLLPVQDKRSKQPGDSAAMVTARRQFLEQGHYAPLIDHILEALPEKSMDILDAGCGEGYYTAAFAQMRPDKRFIGLDISKDAIHAATSRSRAVTWLVGSNRNLPLSDHSMDVIVCLFGFPVLSEFQRVLKREGVLVTVNSGSDHLLELRHILYPEGVSSKDGTEATLRYKTNFLDAETLVALTAMTPHAHRAPGDWQERLRHAAPLAVTVSCERKIIPACHLI